MSNLRECLCIHKRAYICHDLYKLFKIIISIKSRIDSKLGIDGIKKKKKNIKTQATESNLRTNVFRFYVDT